MPLILLFEMSDAVQLQLIISLAGLAGIIVAGIFSYLAVRQSKVNGVKADAAAGQAVIAAGKADIAAGKAEEAKTAATETTRKQDQLIEKTDVIEHATNSNLEKLTRKVSELEAKLEASHQVSLRLAEASNPAHPPRPTLDASIPIPLPVTVVEPEDGNQSQD